MSDAAESQATPKQVPTPPDKLTLWESLKSLTIGQVWALIGCLVAIVVGSAALGSWAQSAHDDDKIADKNATIAEKNATIQDLKSHQSQDAANVEAAKNALKAMEANDRAIKGKQSFWSAS